MHPQAMGTDEKEFSLNDLTSLDSLEEARAIAIERRVDSATRGTIDDWAEWLEKRVKIPARELSLDREQTREVFLRRHLHVHTGGRVDQRYLSNVNSSSS